MADGIVINGGIDDLKLSSVFDGDSIQDILGNFGNKLVQDLTKSLSAKGKNATLRLSQSIDFNIEVLGSLYYFTLSMADYYEEVDKGTPPGTKPDPTKIADWARV